MQALKRQSGAKNIVINFKQGTAEATWKKGARFDLDAIIKTVSKSSELTFRSLELTAAGEVSEPDGKPALMAAGSMERLLLAEDATAGKATDPVLSNLLAASRSGQKVFVVTGRVQRPDRSRQPREEPSPLTLVVQHAAPVSSGK